MKPARRKQLRERAVALTGLLPDVSDDMLELCGEIDSLTRELEQARADNGTAAHDIEQLRKVVFELEQDAAVDKAEVVMLRKVVFEAEGDAADKAELVKLRQADVEQAQAVVAKLPTYTDTGKPFVPGRDDAWINVWSEGGRRLAHMHWRPNHHGGRGEWHYFTEDVDNSETAYVGPAYSTEAAALAAKGD